ncbi:MAG: flagellar motor switch protein FliG [Phycisphaerae bacterium]|nr:flagellar motor switch protein FliG [Phycisphaerae bacterium]|tara:strand:+ start:14520 stop:15560 length:1041 start_codon:yes stop_codon:yes gene_type:complete
MSFRIGQKLPDKLEDIDGVVKSAILLLSLDEGSASNLLRCLPQDVVQEVTAALATLEEVPNELIEGVIEEFYNLQLANRYVREGGLEYAKRLLRESLDPDRAAHIIGQIETQVQRTPFSFLQRVEAETLLTFIQDEHPQTIALIVSHLGHARASEILVGLPEDKQVEVVRRVANMDQTNPDIVQEVEAGLEDRLSNMLASSSERVGGIETVAEVLNLCDRTTEKKIMDDMEHDSPQLVEEIRRLMFVFEDIVHVDNKGIQSVLREIDNSELALSLKTASDELKEIVFSNMSTRAADLIVEDMEYMGPVRLSDVESAQQRIVDVVRRLEDAGELIITSRGGESELVV